jgi:WD40 repeat protein
MNMDISRHNLRKSDMGIEKVDKEMDTYKAALSSALLDDGNSRVLAFGKKAPEPKGDAVNNLNVLYSDSMGAADRKKKSSSLKLVHRQISSAPARILDASDILDDYYLNLMSWSDTNVLAVALQKTVYLWDASSGNITEPCTVEGDSDAHVASLSWVQEQGGAHIAVGTSCSCLACPSPFQCLFVCLFGTLSQSSGHTESKSREFKLHVGFESIIYRMLLVLAL